MSAKNQTLAGVVNDICDVIIARRSAGKNFGVVLIPEGFITSIADIKLLLAEITDLLKSGAIPFVEIPKKLTKWSSALFETLPKETGSERV